MVLSHLALIECKSMDNDRQDPLVKDVGGSLSLVMLNQQSKMLVELPNLSKKMMKGYENKEI